MKIKAEFQNSIKPTNFTDGEKEILKKTITSMEIQETQYYKKGSYSYELTWYDIVPLLLTEEEKTSGFGYFIVNYSWNMWNDLIDMFEQVFDMPKSPEGLSRFNSTHRKTDEFKAYLEHYNEIKLSIIQAYIDEWNDKKETYLIAN